MRTAIFTMLASMTAAAMLTVSAANASVYKFDYQASGANLGASGEFTVDAGGEVTWIKGTISGQVDATISEMVANPNFPGAAFSPDSAFIYDNLFQGGTQPLDGDGLLFTSKTGAGGYWNLWGNSATNYSLYESAQGGGYPVMTSGSFSAVTAPEPSTWVMLALGFASLGYAAARRGPRPAVGAFARDMSPWDDR